MSKKIINIPTISKIDFLHTTDESFGSPKTIAMMSCYTADNQYESFRISSIDFATGIIESQEGNLYQTSDFDKLTELSDELGIKMPEEIPELKSKDVTREQIADIIVEDDTMILGDKKYKILSMHYDISSDEENGIIKSKIQEKEAELDSLASSPDANSAKMAELSEKLNNATAYLAENPDISMSMFKGANATFIVQDRATGACETIRLENLTYSDLANMTGFEKPDVKTTDSELISKLEEMSSQISKANTSHAYHVAEDAAISREARSFNIDGDKVTMFVDDKKRTFHVDKIEVTHSKYGLSVTIPETITQEKNGTQIIYPAEELTITSVAKDCPYRSTTTLYRAVCDAKEQESLLDMRTSGPQETPVMQQVSSMGVTLQYQWSEGSRSPQEQYIVAGQKMGKQELVANIYASETNGFIAMRIGDDTQIMMVEDSPIAKSTKEITEVIPENGKYYIDGKDGKTQVDYLDTENSILIANGVVYKCSPDLQIEAIGAEGTPTPISYINPETNQIASVAKMHTEISDKVINNWDIVSEDGKFFLAENKVVEKDGQSVVEAFPIKEIKNMSIDEDSGLLRVKFDRGFAYLGAPSSEATISSVFEAPGEKGIDKLSMKDAVDRAENGISTIISQVNERVAQKSGENVIIKNPQSLVRDVPDDSFVVMNNKIYYKTQAINPDNTPKLEMDGKPIHILCSKDETLDYNACRGQIQYSFAVSRDAGIELINTMSEQNLYTITKDFTNIREISVVTEKSIREAMHYGDEKSIDMNKIRERYLPEESIERISIIDDSHAKFSTETDKDVVDSIELKESDNGMDHE